MYIMTGAKKVDFFWKLINQDYSNILCYPFVPQKRKDTVCSSQPLPQTTPEQTGISSNVLCDFYKELSIGTGLDPHAAVIVKSGKVISHSAWKPFRTNVRHVTYSLCKSIVSLAVGIAQSEGLISLQERIVDIFPEKTSFLVSKNMREVTVRHLLTMTSGARFCEADFMLEEDWVKGFLDSDTKFQPGTKFEYNSLNTYMLCAILHKRSNIDLTVYLQPRLFTPLGIHDVQWEKCPRGIVKGGWGCYLSADELAKLGQLYLNMGRWTLDGIEIQLVPRKWIEDSTAGQIKDTNRPGEYGYQIWRFKDMDGYMFNGMFGQYVIVLPEQDMVIALNGGCDSFFAKPEILQIVKRLFVDEKRPFESSKADFSELQRIDGSLEFRKPVFQPPEVKTGFQRIARLFKRKRSNTLPKQVSLLDGKSYKFAKAAGGLLPLVVQVIQGNFSKGIQSLSFTEQENTFYILIKDGNDLYRIPLGFDEYRYSDIKISGEYYGIGVKADFATDEDEHMVLKITLCFTEIASTRFMKIFFIGDGKIVLKITEYPHVDTLLADSIRSHQQYIPAVVKETLEDEKEFVDFLFQQISAPTLYGESAPNLHMCENDDCINAKCIPETRFF